jgi:hypothetical protein
LFIIETFYRFYTLFVKDFGINVCTFVWDRFLFEGEVAIYRGCLAAFWCLREHLIAEGLQGVSAILQDPSKFVTTANFEAAYSTFSTLDYDILSKALDQVCLLKSILLAGRTLFEVAFEKKLVGKCDVTRLCRHRAVQMMHIRWWAPELDSGGYVVGGEHSNLRSTRAPHSVNR